MSNIPVANAPNLYVNGLVLSWLSNTTLGLTSGAARDSTNIGDIQLTAGVTINAANTGANGLDTGALANNTWYAVYVATSSTGIGQPVALLSTSFTAPTLPFGYDFIRRVGCVLTDGSAHFLNFTVGGNNNLRKYFWDAVITELSAGAATSFTDVDMKSSLPPTSTIALLNWKLVPATAGNLTKLRTNGSSSTTNIQLTGPVASQPATGMVSINTDSAQIIEYQVANASDALTLYCAGFEDFI